MLNFSVPETQTINYAAVTDLDGVQTVFHVVQLTAQEAHPDSLEWGEKELSTNNGCDVRLVKLTPKQALRWWNKADHVKSLALAVVLMTPTLRKVK
ncbi:hypothetical protein I5R92_25265 [Pseudomonas carnis]|uniref:hypothetical protein n=1 Tax=Pseudomonas carnis TaxID=2487355 RepID=UPI0018D84E4B|nr:hypothetical protein [Pseudomonas carnis]MBH3370606.1 hypothetical protein [Pseudomonas carnis]